MTHTYDWSKLDEGWRHSRGVLCRLSDCGSIVVTTLERWYQGVEDDPVWAEFKSAALDQLAKCRIPAPDIATVTELRPRDEYDWSRLKGSGWRHAMGDNEHKYITDGTWCFWYTEVTAWLQNPCPFSLNEAIEANESARSLVAKCKRDWRDEVKQACEGIDGLAELYLMLQNELRLRAEASPQWFGLAFHSDRTFDLIDGVQTLEWVLKLSLIIERLKKLGWSEA